MVLSSWPRRSGVGPIGPASGRCYSPEEAPGRNGHVESLSSKLPDELLNQELS